MLVHDPRSYILNDSEDKQFNGISDYFQSWPKSDITQWPGENFAKLGKDVNEGGCWSGGVSLIKMSSYVSNGSANHKHSHVFQY